MSYSRAIAPIFALHCNACHGDAGGLSTRTYPDLMKGGNLGLLVVPGDPERSLLVHFVEGRRGEAHRMPLGGRPLRPEQIAALRRWISEGAQPDAAGTEKFMFTTPRIRTVRGKVLRIACRVNTQAYLTLVVSDARTRAPLHTEVASVKSPPQPGDMGQPGDRLTWDLRAARNWPKWIALELIVQYPLQEPRGTEFSAQFVN